MTMYADHHFETELDARWAVFFDTLAIPYEYETYTQDDTTHSVIWLPDHQYWIEVKDQVPDAKEYERVCQIANQIHYRVVLAIGEIKIPSDEETLLSSDSTDAFTSLSSYSPGAQKEDPDTIYPDSLSERWAQCKGCGHIELATYWTAICSSPSCIHVQADKVDRKRAQMSALFARAENSEYLEETRRADRRFSQKMRMQLLKEGNGALLSYTPRLIAAYRAARHTQF